MKVKAGSFCKWSRQTRLRMLVAIAAEQRRTRRCFSRQGQHYAPAHSTRQANVTPIWVLENNHDQKRSNAS